MQRRLPLTVDKTLRISALEGATDHKVWGRFDSCIRAKYTHMRQPKVYVNGITADSSQQGSDFRRAKELLIKAGVYRKMGNFGPFYPNKKSRIYTVLETLVIEEMEYTIIESEVMSFSLGSMSMSKPYMEKEAWFQPTKR
jgi:hypothetical protein